MHSSHRSGRLISARTSRFCLFDSSILESRLLSVSFHLFLVYRWKIPWHFILQWKQISANPWQAVFWSVDTSWPRFVVYLGLDETWLTIYSSSTLAFSYWYYLADILDFPNLSQSFLLCSLHNEFGLVPKYPSKIGGTDLLDCLVPKSFFRIFLDMFWKPCGSFLLGVVFLLTPLIATDFLTFLRTESLQRKAGKFLRFFWSHCS